jgi:UTP--glucose-1-phosphate uridylyltransferase
MATHESQRFIPFEEKMRAAGVHDIVVRTFQYQFMELIEGGSGMISRNMIDPVMDVPDADHLKGYKEAGKAALPHTVVIKLNGGLGTSMGLERAKSLLPVKNDLSFLDIIARQNLHLRKRTGVKVPLLLMNSYNTHADSLAVLESYKDLASKLPFDFLQNKVPKVVAEDFCPAVWPDAPELEWCPPGHGDIYAALSTSGLLKSMLKKGYLYAFISNADNLGAVLDPMILGYFAAEQIGFMMEVADRTIVDRKGGHLARRKDGRLMLREVAQCPSEEMEEFQDVNTYKYFNTNSLWINLRALDHLLVKNDGIMPLPFIQNLKTLDPRDPRSPRVYQLETAMGAAISAFDKAAALRVPRTRFAPVKTTDDLLGLWSDATVLTDDYQVIQNPKRSGKPLSIELDRNHYKLIDQMLARFPHGAPSLVECSDLRIDGDVHFGRNIRIVGSVHITAPKNKARHIADGEIIEGK